METIGKPRADVGQCQAFVSALRRRRLETGEKAEA